jgi:cell division transport system permease protein
VASFSQYVVKETTTNLWRNRVTTVAAIFTVMVSLFLVGGSLILGQGASNAEIKWQQGTLVTVWMAPSATAQEIDAIRSQLDAFPYVHDCYYQTQAQDYEEAKHLLTPTELSVLKPELLPSSHRCVPNQPQDARLVMDKFSGQPGVQVVTAPTQALKNQQRTIAIAQWSVLVIASVLLVSSAVLILNTIRMAIFARKREVAVMKLVGATNWFIRVPFIFEGLIQGLIGSLMAGGLLWAGEWFWHSRAANWAPDTLGSQMLLSSWQLIWCELIVIFLGMVIGSIGSAIAIRRFLDV